MKKRKNSVPKLIEIKGLDNDYVILASHESCRIVARAKTYDRAREKAILLKLPTPRIVREKDLVAK